MQDHSPQCSSSPARPTHALKRSHDDVVAKPDLGVFSSNCSIAANETVTSLTLKDCDFWTSGVAAKFASGRYMPTCRRLGIISRTLVADANFAMSNPNKRAKTASSKEKIKKNKKQTLLSMPLPTLAQSKAHIQRSSKNVDRDLTELERKARNWQQAWKTIRTKGSFIPGWKEGTGELVSEGDAISCCELLKCMTEKQPSLRDDTSTPAFCSLYPNITARNDDDTESLIACDTISVLKVLIDLMSPQPALYDQPLVVTRVQMFPLSEGNKLKLQIAVYANRLLFECMTQQLQVVMAALDPSSFQMDQHLQVPPGITLQTNDFASAEFPKVVIEEDKNKTNMDDEEEVEALEGSTRYSRKTIDAFSIPGLFKLIENKGTFDESLWNETLQPKLAQTQDHTSGLELELLLHQKHGVCWMYRMERLGNLNRLIWERRQFCEGDSYYYSPALGQVRLALSEDITESSVATTNWGGGGVLSDEMGLGKTAQTLALIVATLDDVKQMTLRQKEEYEGEEDQKTICHSTLVIVPPALLSQWISEIKKTAPWLVVDAMVHGGGRLERVQQPSHATNPEQDADIVVTTYQALEDNYCNSTKKKKKRQPRQSKNSQSHFPAPIETLSLAGQTWGRIVLDEMQEIRSWTTRISKLVNSLQSDCRWMLSGTPLLDDVTDLRGELCFLRLEPFCASNDDGFFQFAVANHWQHKSRYGLSILRKLAELIMLRRSKTMVIQKTGLPLLGLKPFTLTYEPVPQDDSERALYCFLEFLMHSTVPKLKQLSMDQEELEADKNMLRRLKEQQRNKTTFLRLLRELCVSPTLLNGGLGCASQLDTLNRWMKDYNRRLHQEQTQTLTSRSDRQQSRNAERASPSQQSRHILSCDEAVRFLSQVEDLARTDADYVTDIRVGGGGGISSRNRALESLEERYEQESKELERAKSLCYSSLRKRARSNWQLALEGVTTGRLFANNDRDSYRNVNPRIHRLWYWRYCVGVTSPACTKILPSMLLRGWRPSENFLGESPTRKREEALMSLFQRQPKFYWAYPFSLIFSDIPCSVTRAEIHNSVVAFLQQVPGESEDAGVNVIALSTGSPTKGWKAVVNLNNKDDYDHILKKAKKVEGIELICANRPPWIEDKVQAAKIKLGEAVAANRVHPCALTVNDMTKAKKEYLSAKLGLRIFMLEKSNSGHVHCMKALGHIRTTAPSTSEALRISTLHQIQEATALIEEHGPTIESKERQLQKMKMKIDSGVTDNIGQLTTVEALHALKEDQADQTLCPICYDTLGQDGGLVALTRCGHLCCRGCMMTWMRQKELRMQNPSCIECRKAISRDQLVFVDPKKTDDQEQFERRRVEAKSLLQQAAEMLDKNHGRLEPHLWEALYLSMPLPAHLSRSAHNAFTAIPPHVLAHLRNATSMPIHCTRKQPADSTEYRLSSKVRALLSDIPRDEVSVVFASSRLTVQHLLVVFEKHGIGCCGLFTGQTERESEIAVSKWQSDDSVLVLVVQAGVAACGLTLTKASKMFLMDPFLKHEEEKQAYARLHRYGQEKEVFCKVYYSPVSVESRLLEWRHRFESQEDLIDEDENRTIFAPLRDVSRNEEDHTEDMGQKQTQFLLGLT